MFQKVLTTLMATTTGTNLSITFEYRKKSYNCTNVHIREAHFWAVEIDCRMLIAWISTSAITWNFQCQKLSWTLWNVRQVSIYIVCSTKVTLYELQ